MNQPLYWACRFPNTHIYAPIYKIILMYIINHNNNLNHLLITLINNYLIIIHISDNFNIGNHLHFWKSLLQIFNSTLASFTILINTKHSIQLSFTLKLIGKIRFSLLFDQLPWLYTRLFATINLVLLNGFSHLIHIHIHPYTPICIILHIYTNYLIHTLILVSIINPTKSYFKPKVNQSPLLNIEAKGSKIFNSSQF